MSLLAMANEMEDAAIMHHFHAASRSNHNLVVFIDGRFAPQTGIAKPVGSDTGRLTSCRLVPKTSQELVDETLRLSTR